MHPYTPEGRQLLKNFQIEIQRNGGIYRTYKAILRERNKRIYKFKESAEPVPQTRESIICNLWHKKSIPQIAKIVGLGETRVREIGKFLLLGERKYVQNYEEHGYLVLNTQTGIYYNSVVLAAKSVNKDASVLSKKLIGKRRNNTSFIRV